MYYVTKLLTLATGGDGSKIEGVHSDENSAMVQYHGLCRDLRNDQATQFRALVMVLNEFGTCKIMETIDHLPQPETTED